MEISFKEAYEIWQKLGIKKYIIKEIRGEVLKGIKEHHSDNGGKNTEVMNDLTALLNYLRDEEKRAKKETKAKGEEEYLTPFEEMCRRHLQNEIHVTTTELRENGKEYFVSYNNTHTHVGQTVIINQDKSDTEKGGIVCVAALRGTSAYEVIIEEGITEIEGGRECKNIRARWGDQLNAVDMCNSEKGYNKCGAFCFAISLSIVKLPHSLKSIGAFAFRRCFELKDINLQDTQVSYIGRYAFAEDRTLKSIKLPNTIEIIGEYAFAKCNAVKEISIPAGATVEEFAFYNMDRLEKITIGKGATIKDNAFSFCSNVRRVFVDANEFDSNTYDIKKMGLGSDAKLIKKEYEHKKSTVELNLKPKEEGKYVIQLEDSASIPKDVSLNCPTAKVNIVVAKYSEGRIEIVYYNYTDEDIHTIVTVEYRI